MRGGEVGAVEEREAPPVKGAGNGGMYLAELRGVVNRVLYTLHTLHTFFERKGYSREG